MGMLNAFERLLGIGQGVGVAGTGVNATPPRPQPTPVPHALLDNGTGPQTAPIPSFIGNQYATRPDMPQFRGVDPSIFGYGGPGGQPSVDVGHLMPGFPGRPSLMIPGADPNAPVQLRPGVARPHNNHPFYGA